MSDTQINREALFSAETQDYRMPSEPDAGDMVQSVGLKREVRRSCLLYRKEESCFDEKICF